MKLAALCYLRRGEQTLMLHRNKRSEDYHFGKWNGVGGKLQPGESPEDCARREILEESGLTVDWLRMRGIITFPLFDSVDDWYVFCFEASGISGELRDSAEGTLEWIENSELLNLELWPGDRIFLPWLNQEKFFSAKFVYVQGALQGHEVTFY